MDLLQIRVGFFSPNLNDLGSAPLLLLPHHPQPPCAQRRANHLTKPISQNPVSRASSSSGTGALIQGVAFKDKTSKFPFKDLRIYIYICEIWPSRTTQGRFGQICCRAEQETYIRPRRQAPCAWLYAWGVFVKFLYWKSQVIFKTAAIRTQFMAAKALKFELLPLPRLHLHHPLP